MPAVVVTGARQTGKCKLVEMLVPGESRCRSLDDLVVARRDPEVLVGGPGCAEKPMSAATSGVRQSFMAAPA